MWEVKTPYPNFHACRVRDPDDFQKNSFRQIEQEADGKPLVLVIGRLKGETSTTLQSFRYPRDSWDADEAEAHCRRNDGQEFEPATGEEMWLMNSKDLLELERRLHEADCQALCDFKSGKADAPRLYKPFGYLKAADKDGDMIFVASEESEDRIGDVISVAGWQLDGFRANPMFMFCHDYRIPPIGTVPKVWVEGNQLLNTIAWDEPDEFAMFVKGKYKRKVMRAESVGFRPIEFSECEHGFKFMKQELLEISAVPIPMHPHALAKMMEERKFTIVMPNIPATSKSVISYAQAHPNGTPAADRGAEWDAGKEVSAASVDDLKVMCAWVDAENRENKGGYKLPHHRAGGEHPVVFRALAAVIAVLNGARGGADIPDGDRQGAYNHVARHMRDDFEQEPPPLKSMGEMADLILKIGAVLNRTNREKISKAIGMLQEVLASAEPSEAEPEEAGFDMERVRLAIRDLTQNK